MSRRHQTVSRSAERPPPAAERVRPPAVGIGWRVALVVLGAWSILPPYLGPAIGLDLNVKSSVEVVDHVVPGVVIVLCAGLTALLVLRNARAEESLLVMMLIGVCALAGLWQTVTHAPLVLDGGDPGSPWDSVLLHSTPGPFLVVLSIWLFMRTPEPEQTAELAP